MTPLIIMKMRMMGRRNVIMMMMGRMKMMMMMWRRKMMMMMGRRKEEIYNEVLGAIGASISVPVSGELMSLQIEMIIGEPALNKEVP